MNETTLVYLLRKRMREGENAMADRGLKSKTFKWVLGHVRICKLISREFGVIIKYDWRKIYQDEGIGVFFQTLLADFIVRMHGNQYGNQF